MLGALLAEAVHRQSLVLRAVLVDGLLRDSDELKLGHARLYRLDDLLRGDVRDVRRLAQTGYLVVRLDRAQLDHDLIGADYLRLREGVLYALHDDDVGVEPRRHADAELLARDADRLERVVEGVELDLRIRRVGALAVLVKNEYFLDHAEIGGKDLTLRTDHQRNVAARRNRYAASLKQRPEIRKITCVGVVRLASVHDERVKPPFADLRRGVLYSLRVFLARDLYSWHFLYLL